MVLFKCLKGEKIINKFKVILAVFTVFLLAACNATTSKTKVKIEHFSSKEKAFQHYIKNENVAGSIDLITTLQGDKLLVTQERTNIYFVGELKKDDNGFYAEKITSGAQLTTETGWELNTLNGNKYTIYFNKTSDEPNYVSISNGEYFVSILEGHTLSEDTSNTKNAIKNVENVKK
ncbi:hypothetical protein [Neobacillus drentensis]|uniref:hypothetical protein n=1 Tax=Neobacillus drentensis TaxID=220684 RepID=UPI00286669A2|nr:hypothetical protein [Neobacillus drentensis]MDR7240575.1 hypothetical protein [Neobacillus drentensis]